MSATVTPVDWEDAFNRMGAAFQATVDDLHGLCVAVLGADPDTENELELAVQQASHLRAEVIRLRGLINGMHHAHGCGANFYVGTKRGPLPCDCIKSQVNP